MRLVKHPISIKELIKISEKRFGDFVKAVVDVEKETMVIDGELHADEEAYLLKEGSSQENLWGINLYPGFFGKDEFIEYDSMINVRPSLGNVSRGVDGTKTREKIKRVVKKLIKP